MTDFFNRSYPHEPFSVKNIRGNLGIGLFISFFLIVFQPFEINEWETNYKILKLLGFGFVSFLFCSLVQVLLVFLFSKNSLADNWKVWKEILIILLIVVSITFGNMLLANLYRLSHFYFSQFIYVLTITFLTGIFPIIASVAFKYQKFLSMNKKMAREIDQEIESRKARESTSSSSVLSNERIILIAENNKDTFELFSRQLLYIESTDNYSTIFFMTDGKKKKELIRASLKRLETQITTPLIARCHRSYIVNLSNAAHITGNVQGYRITFNGTEDTIPVSRNHGKDILERIKAMN